MNLELVENDEMIMFPTAQEIREEMPTRDSIFTERFTSFVKQLFENIVGQSKQAKYNFSCGVGDEYFGLTVEETNRLLTDTEKVFTDKGFNVSIQKNEDSTTKMAHRLLTINWNPNETNLN